MKIEEFVDDLIGRLSVEFGTEFILSYQKTLKNNSIEQDCIVIRKKGMSVAPSIYISGYFLEYINGRDFEEIIKDIMKVYSESREIVNEGVCSIIDTSEPEKKTVAKLVNYEMNRKILKECLYDRVLDLAVMYYYISEYKDNVLGYIKLTHENCGLFNLTPEVIRKNAIENTMRMFPAEFDSMENYFRELLGRTENSKESLDNKAEDEEIFRLPKKLFLLTTRSKQEGAVSVIYPGLLDRVRKALGTDFYIIPSSIHEVIIVPDDGSDRMEILKKMVSEVNRSCVPKQEILSDTVYHYPEDQFVVSVSEGAS